MAATDPIALRHHLSMVLLLIISNQADIAGKINVKFLNATVPMALRHALSDVLPKKFRLS